MMELLVSIAILGTVSVGFLGALITGYRTVRLSHDLTTAQSLTRTALENVATAPFPMDTENDDVTTADDYYDVVVHADFIDSEHVVLENPTQLQMITVTVRYHETGKPIRVTQCVKAQP